MIRIIVRVRGEGEREGRDLEVPAEVPVEQLTEMIAQGLEWRSPEQGSGCGYYVRVEPTGRVLQPRETLSDAGVWDGSELVFSEVSRAKLVSDSGNEYQLAQPNILIGRANEKAHSRDAQWIDLTEEPRGNTVSRRHARICYKDCGWKLIPLSSARNLTSLNDEPIDFGRQYELVDDDSLQFGAVRLRFKEGC